MKNIYISKKHYISNLHTGVEITAGCWLRPTEEIG